MTFDWQKESSVMFVCLFYASVVKWQYLCVSLFISEYFFRYVIVATYLLRYTTLILKCNILLFLFLKRGKH